MAVSGDVVTRHAWNSGCLCSNMLMYSETFALEDNPAIKFALFIKNNTSNRYGFPFGLQLQRLEGTGSVDMHIRIWIQGEHGSKSDDRVGRLISFISIFLFQSVRKRSSQLETRANSLFFRVEKSTIFSMVLIMAERLFSNRCYDSL